MMTTLCVILALLLFLSVYKCIKLGMTILRMEDAIEECLDVIDEKYEQMNEILQRPLFYDSPEVKAVVRDISTVRDSLHSVALSLTKNIEENKEE
mgnify:CR=1 FL=1|tara:strand:- start:139 stop:423 length:285 start_codon:yes stop_codon:yes gene_type:complete